MGSIQRLSGLPGAAPGPLNLHHHPSPRRETASASDSYSHPHSHQPHNSAVSAVSARSRTASTASSTFSSSSTVRRKPVPLSTHLSPRSPHASLSVPWEYPEDVFAQKFSSDSPTLYEFPSTASAQRFSRYVLRAVVQPSCVGITF